MHRKSLYLLVTMAVVGIIMLIIQGEYNSKDIFINVIWLLIIIIIHLLKMLYSKYFKIFSIFQSVIGIAMVSLGNIGGGLVLPIIFFDLIDSKINTCISFLLSTIILYRVLGNWMFEIGIYSLLIIIFLNETRNNEIVQNKQTELNERIRQLEFCEQQMIANMDNYIEKNKVTTILKERDFMAQKIHDHLGHTISSSIMQLEITKAKIGADNEMSMKYLNGAMRKLREGLDEIREFLRNIKPMDKLISVEEISELITKFQFESGIKTVFAVNGDISSLKAGLLFIFRENIREALTNAAKYSKATRIKVTFEIYKKFIRVEIRDNGIGCDKVVLGLGLKGMQARMKTVNGRLDYYNDKGFVLNMVVGLECENGN